MTPQEAVSAFFNTMRSETDQAGLMYSQFAVVQALDYVIDRWEDLNPLARDKAGNRTREWLEHLETVFGGMSTEELCAHKFDFSAELRDIADRGFTEDRVIPTTGRTTSSASHRPAPFSPTASTAPSTASSRTSGTRAAPTHSTPRALKSSVASLASTSSASVRTTAPAN